MGPGQHLHRLGQLAVAGHRAVIVGIGAGQLGQHLGVAGIGLGSRGRVALPVARGRHRVHRQHLVAGGHQGADEQAPVGLGGHHHLGWLVGEGSHQLVEAGHALNPLG